MNALCNWVDLFRSGQFSSCRHTVDKPLASLQPATVRYATVRLRRVLVMSNSHYPTRRDRIVVSSRRAVWIEHYYQSFDQLFLVVGQLGQNSFKTTAINVERNFRLIFSAFVRLCDYRRMLPFRDSRFLRGPTITFSDGEREATEEPPKMRNKTIF